MSWSVRVEVSPADNHYSKIRQLLYEAFDENETAKTTSGSQKEFAIDSALAAIGGVVRPIDGLIINLSGHYNPDLAPKDGWASCMINVSVSQVYAKEPVSA